MNIIKIGLFLLFTLNSVINLNAQINFPGGRIAILHDGNFRDPDDIGAMPMGLAILDHAGLADHLVYLEHSHFIGCNDEEMEQEMIKSLDGAIERFGPFPNAQFFNYYRESEKARNALIEEINLSSADNPLWIVCAGRMESLYRAIKGADEEKRDHLILVSHSIYNEDHTRDRSKMDSVCTGMIHTWDYIKGKYEEDGIYFIESSNRSYYPENPHKLTDQNFSNGDYDFQTPHNKWKWLNKMGEKYEWLFSRNKIDKAFDVSDAGMLWFIITGGVDFEKNKKTGCETCGWQAIKQLFDD